MTIKALGCKQMQTTREIQNGEKEAEKRKKTTTTLSEKKEEASNVSEQWDKGWIHIICVHDATHLAVTTIWQGNRRSRTTVKERTRGLVKHQDYPPHLYIINERYNPRNKRRRKRKKQSMARTGPTPNHNPGRPRNRVY